MTARDLPIGLLRDMPAADYHAVPALSNSAINKLAQSPWHYWSEYLDPTRPAREPSAAMRAGTLAHCAILEPEALLTRYAVRPADLDGRTKEGKAWLASVPADREVITAEQMATAMAQAAAVQAVPELASALAVGHAEASVFWIDQATGVHCKCRPDWVHPLGDGRVIIVDVKTTPEPSAKDFARSVANYGYHRQAAHYCAGYAAATGTEVAAFIFAAVSSAWPYWSVPYMLDDAALERGQREVAELIAKYRDCAAAGVWPKPTDGVQLLSLPAWA